MVKSVIKEIIITLLLCVAIVLILGILFYDYIPTNKVVPAKEAYTTPNNVREEIEEQITEIQKTEISYEITGSDLNIYKQSNSYVQGKENPFALVSDQANNVNTNAVGNPSTGNPNTNSTGNGNTGTGNSSGNTNNNSTGTFFNDVK